MKLKQYRVTDFRSVKDSGWIEVDDVTALIGTNESGKTNLLLPLWRLNPATDEGKVNVVNDHPRKWHNEFRKRKPQPIFIEAQFEVDDSMAAQMAQLTGASAATLKTVSVSRRFEGEPFVGFPGVPTEFTTKLGDLHAMLEGAAKQITDLPPEEDEAIRASAQAALAHATESLPADEAVSGPQLKAILDPLKQAVPDNATSMVAARFKKLTTDLAALLAKLDKKHPRDSEEAKKLVLSRLPKFVYYSNYGNLDSEIYLPRVIENLARTDMGQKELARARTLKVLFEFVKLTPKEILDLGKEPDGKPTEDQTKETAEKKKERSILLQSASSQLTGSFRDWWKQGDYRFRFEADGNFFRLWVSDDKRPDEVELEGRSSGLQWFLSFYLVFLVESGDRHSNSILLLDEPGVSLHPLSQRDLSIFFDTLAKRNQLLYTTHSPFLVDADRLDRARKVFVDSDGTSKATPDLGAKDGDATQRGASYAVHAAVGLTIADSLLLGCTPIIVEGASDQHYLTAIKIILTREGKLNLGRELVFPPAGGAKGAKAVSTILTGRDNQLPIVLLDSDEAGRAFAKKLRDELYAASTDRVLSVGSFTTLPDAEIEDLIPADFIVATVDRWCRNVEQPFEDVYAPGKPIVPQIETWAGQQGIELKKPGWKAELAKVAKPRLLQLRSADLAASIPTWERLFKAMQSGE